MTPGTSFVFRIRRSLVFSLRILRSSGAHVRLLCSCLIVELLPRMSIDFNPTLLCGEGLHYICAYRMYSTHSLGWPSFVTGSPAV
jgi:hypothetical protein